MKPQRPRVGLIGQASRGWSAGATYTRMLLQSLVAAGGAERFELVLLTGREGADIARGLPVRTHLLEGAGHALPEAWAAHLAPRAGRLLRLSARAVTHALGFAPEPPALFAAERLGLAAILPVQQLPRRVRCGAAGWIPDFQHVHEPSFFSVEERQQRDAVFHELAANATRVILSSAWARQHFEAFAPTHAHKAVELPFPSTFAFEPPRGPAGEAARELGLPARFALVVNQLWQHKNHELVVAAVAEARARGVDVPVVMVGAPADYRDPENGTVSRILQGALRARVHDLVFVLGKVPFPTLVDLMRGAAVMIQPSRFEGWSTSVEDARALGRPLLCSALPVHREQAPDALGFFGCDDPGALASALVERWRELPPGPDAAAESAGLERERAFAARHGERLLGLIEVLIQA
jgi:glycosyltransferase involved in cell wall biosynthesis